MDKFERANRRTREQNARNVDRFNTSAQSNSNTGNWRLNYLNQQTFYNNNGVYSNVY